MLTDHGGSAEHFWIDGRIFPAIQGRQNFRFVFPEFSPEIIGQWFRCPKSDFPIKLLDGAPSRQNSG